MWWTLTTECKSTSAKFIKNELLYRMFSDLTLELLVVTLEHGNTACKATFFLDKAIVSNDMYHPCVFFWRKKNGLITQNEICIDTNLYY